MKDNTVLTPHFKLREFTKSATAKKHGIDNRPTPEVVENLRRLCTHTLEPLREKLGLPIVITSGYRTKELNDIIVHASRKSQHMEGRAADFYVVQGSKLFAKFNLFIGAHGLRHKVQGSKFKVQSSKFKVQGDEDSKLNVQGSRELLIRAFRLIIDDEDIDFDQLIIYPTFIHVSYVSKEKNRHQLTRASSNGAYTALSRADALSLA